MLLKQQSSDNSEMIIELKVNDCSWKIYERLKNEYGEVNRVREIFAEDESCNALLLHVDREPVEEKSGVREHKTYFFQNQQTFNICW